MPGIVLDPSVLIEAMDDRRFTRTLGWKSGFGQYYYIVRVGDAASEILSAIAGRRIGFGTVTGTTPHPDALAKRGQALARAWWAEELARSEAEASAPEREEAAPPHGR